MSPSEIQELRGSRSRAELAQLLGVTALTVYRWELPPEAEEARRPRGKVLARLRAFAETQGSQGTSIDATYSPAGEAVPLEPHELAALRPLLLAIDDCHFEEAESQLVSLLSTAVLHTAGARGLASAMLARLCLLARHDTKSAFNALLGVSSDLGRLPSAVQLEYHLSSAFLFAHSDAQLFNPGKTNHHAVLAQQLMPEGSADQRVFLWYARYTAAVSLYDIALLARAMEALPAMRDLASSALCRCLCAEAATVSSLSVISTVEGGRRLDELRVLAEERGLPLQELRSRLWRAEISTEEAAAPAQVLALLDDAGQLLQRHRIANGIHVMLMLRNKGETLMRMGQLRTAEGALLEAVRVSREIAFTPIRIVTALARLYFLTGQIEALSKLAQDAIAASDAQREISRSFGHVLALLCDVYRGDATSDCCERLVAGFEELRRLGVWPVAYRNLALVTLAVVASRGSLRDAERLAQIAERAVELSPSPSGMAALRRHRAALLTRRGKLIEARQALEAALATLQASWDVAEVALVRRALANVDYLDGAPQAAARMMESEAELTALGLPTPAIIDLEAPHSAELPADRATPAEPSEVERLVVPLARLVTRGVDDAFLGKELVSITSELFPERAISLQEINAANQAIELEQRAGRERANVTWLELSNGTGRHFRLGVAGALDSRQRALLDVVATTAGLAFEVAALRGFSAAAPRSEPASAGPEPAALAELVAASASMRKLKTELARLSSSRATIIISGESGTGKELIAKALHDLSRRAAGPYVTFNSATVPRELFEGQLFGHKKGAFTGAHTDHPGVIRSAEGGTLFLDEIGELPLDVQPKLLRFLENGEVLPLGGREPVRVDVRVIAATHRDLRALVREGKFREDLYYRLQVIPVEVSPLRARREDILGLAKHFIRKLTPADAQVPVLTADAEARLLAHAWPGNVRELRNVIERAMAFEPLPRSIHAAELRL